MSLCDLVLYVSITRCYHELPQHKFYEHVDVSQIRDCSIVNSFCREAKVMDNASVQYEHKLFEAWMTALDVAGVDSRP